MLFRRRVFFSQARALVAVLMYTPPGCSCKIAADEEDPVPLVPHSVVFKGLKNKQVAAAVCLARRRRPPAVRTQTKRITARGGGAYKAFKMYEAQKNQAGGGERERGTRQEGGREKEVQGRRGRRGREKEAQGRRGQGERKRYTAGGGGERKRYKAGGGRHGCFEFVLKLCVWRHTQGLFVFCTKPEAGVKLRIRIATGLRPAQHYHVRASKMGIFELVGSAERGGEHSVRVESSQKKDQKCWSGGAPVSIGLSGVGGIWVFSFDGGMEKAGII